MGKPWRSQGKGSARVMPTAPQSFWYDAELP